MSEKLKNDIRFYLGSVFGSEYRDCFPEEFVEEVAEDVKVVSDYLNGHYNDSDIQMAVARTILYRLGVCV